MTRQQWLGFFALCLLGASRWLVEGAFPSLIPTASRDCFHYGFAALALGLFEWRKIAGRNFQAQQVVKICVASIGLLGLPAVLVDHIQGSVSQGTIVALFALLPVVVVLFVPHFALVARSESGTTGLLAPALVGLAGAIFLLPFALPATFRDARVYAIVVFAVVVAASASVWMYRLLVHVRVVEAMLICCLANAIFLLMVSLALTALDGPAWGGQWNLNAIGVETLKALCLDMPQIALLLWLMRDVAPERLAARALVVPLLTVLEGYAVLRPEISGRSAIGAALLIYGAWKLLTGMQRDEEPRLMLR